MTIDVNKSLQVRTGTGAVLPATFVGETDRKVIVNYRNYDSRNEDAYVTVFFRLDGTLSKSDANAFYTEGHRLENVPETTDLSTTTAAIDTNNPYYKPFMSFSIKALTYSVRSGSRRPTGFRYAHFNEQYIGISESRGHNFRFHTDRNEGQYAFIRAGCQRFSSFDEARRYWLGPDYCSTGNKKEIGLILTVLEKWYHELEGTTPPDRTSETPVVPELLRCLKQEEGSTFFTSNLAQARFRVTGLRCNVLRIDIRDNWVWDKKSIEELREKLAEISEFIDD